MSNPTNNPYDSGNNPNQYGDQPYGDSHGGSLPSYGESTHGAGQGAGYPGAGYAGAGPGSGPGAGYNEQGSGYAGYQQYQSYDAGQPGGAPEKKSTLAVAVFVLGIISLLVAVTGFAIVPGVIGVILAIIAFVRNRKKAKEARRTWMSVLGLIFSIIGIVASIIIFGVILLAFTDPVVQECMNTAANTEELQACLESSL